MGTVRPFPYIHDMLEQFVHFRIRKVGAVRPFPYTKDWNGSSISVDWNSPSISVYEDQRLARARVCVTDDTQGRDMTWNRPPLLACGVVIHAAHGNKHNS
jgi:hypothetical protein